MWKIPIVLTTLWKISQGGFYIVEAISVSSILYLEFLTVTIHIVNHLKQVLHISSISFRNLLNFLREHLYYRILDTLNTPSLIQFVLHIPD